MHFLSEKIISCLEGKKAIDNERWQPIDLSHYYKTWRAMMRKVTAVLGIEPYFYPNTNTIKHYSDTFLNNVLTWKHDNPTDKVVIVDARKYIKSPEPMSELWRDVCLSHPEGIDIFLYSGHSSPEHLLVYSHCRHDISDDQRYLGFENAFTMPLSPNAKIYLYGCQAGGKEGEKWENSIAQVMADKTGRLVHAYAYRTSQKQRPDGHYYQKPDRGGLLDFTPQLHLSTSILPVEEKGKDEL